MTTQQLIAYPNYIASLGGASIVRHNAHSAWVTLGDQQVVRLPLRLIQQHLNDGLRVAEEARKFAAAPPKEPKLYLWSVRHSAARGWKWIVEREVQPHEQAAWLEVFEKDEPHVQFEVSPTRPHPDLIAK